MFASNLHETHLNAELSTLLGALQSAVCPPTSVGPEPLLVDCPRAPPLAPRQSRLQDFALIGD